VVTLSLFIWKNGTRTTISADGADVDIEDQNRKNGNDIGETISYEEALLLAQEHRQFAQILTTVADTAERNSHS
jgi:hypothetical protein